MKDLNKRLRELREGRILNKKFIWHEPNWYKEIGHAKPSFPSIITKEERIAYDKWVKESTFNHWFKPVNKQTKSNRS